MVKPSVVEAGSQPSQPAGLTTAVAAAAAAASAAVCGWERRMRRIRWLAQWTRRRDNSARVASVIISIIVLGAMMARRRYSGGETRLSTM
ncbi:hypothetical protein V1521DRAFT_427261 [Lipomyces starkeyi]